MFRKHPQRGENFLEMCVLVPGAGGAAGARGAAHFQGAALAVTESSAGSQPAATDWQGQGWGQRGLS